MPIPAIRQTNRILQCALLWVTCAAFASGLLHSQAAPHIHVFFRVQAASSVAAPLNGRLLIFVKQGSGDKEVNTSEFHPTETWVAAREVHDLAPGATVEFDADEAAYPGAFATIPAGNYEAQAVLDVDHTYNYGGRNRIRKTGSTGSAMSFN